MARFTKDTAEIKQLVSAQRMIIDAGFCVKLTQNDGNVVEGQIARESLGNDFNGHNLNSLNYHGDITIRQLDGTEVTIDMLDIKYVASGKCK